MRGKITNKIRAAAWNGLTPPDRITEPLKRTASGWQPISWDQAMAEIGAKIRALRAERGGDSIAHFVGSPAGANVLAPLFRNAFFKALGSRRFYGTPTTDTTNKFRVNEDMYGSPFRLAFPDVNHCDFLMVIGANPAVSGNTLYHLPRAKGRMRDIVKRGGRVDQPVDRERVRELRAVLGG